MSAASSPHGLTEQAEILLIGLCDKDAQDTDTIDARQWADAIVELLDHGLIELQGTLSTASIVATDAGRNLAARLVAEELPS